MKSHLYVVFMGWKTCQNVGGMVTIMVDGGKGRGGKHRGRAQRDNGKLRVFGWQSNNRNNGRTGGNNTGRFGTT